MTMSSMAGSPSQYGRMTPDGGVSKGFKITIWLAVALMVFTLGPVMAYVYLFDGDRSFAANLTSILYIIGVYLAFAAPWLPTSGMGRRSRYDRIGIMAITWLFISYIMALTWELPWVLFVETFASNEQAWWAYPWMFYADGGDMRYAQFDPLVWTFEAQMSFNGLIGAWALTTWFKSSKTSIAALVVFLMTETSHLYSTVHYYAVDYLTGWASVGDDVIFDLLVKFIILNSPFVVMPIVVIYWAAIQLKTLVESPAIKS